MTSRTGTTDPAAFGRVAVAMGGTAAEREISINSGNAVLQALQKQGVDAVGVILGANPLESLQEGGFDRVFNIVHGRGGEDGELQGGLQSIGMPYTGSGILASALSMDKLKTKLCWTGAGLPTPAWVVLKDAEDLCRCESELGYPLIVKPAAEGSSMGISQAEDRAGLELAWENARTHKCDVFAEAWVHGREYTVGLLGDLNLPMIRLETPNAFYDYEAKYCSDSTVYHCPCGLEASLEKEFQSLGRRAAEILNVSGWGRVDLMLDSNNRPWLIEVNTVPGMTDHSLVPMAAAEAGITFDQLVWRILETSFEC